MFFSLLFLEGMKRTSLIEYPAFSWSTAYKVSAALSSSSVSLTPLCAAQVADAELWWHGDHGPGQSDLRQHCHVQVRAAVCVCVCD